MTGRVRSGITGFGTTLGGPSVFLCARGNFEEALPGFDPLERPALQNREGREDEELLGRASIEDSRMDLLGGDFL